jgi:dTDP-4-amino-4,6-dideoxygalactose transaminase
LYKEALSKISGLTFQKIKHGTPNYSYFPIIFESEAKLLQVEKALNTENIYPRRYFYPSVNTYTNILEYQTTPIAEDVAKRILCLPLYFTLPLDIILQFLIQYNVYEKSIDNH